MSIERPLLIGLMCETRFSTRLKYACAAFALSNEAQFFYFVPEDVHLADKSIEGRTLVKGEWVTRKFEYPDVIHDCIARRGKFHDEVYEELAHIPMTTDKPFNVGDKMQVYRMLRADKRFANLLIPSARVTTTEDVIGRLDRFKEIVLKPVRGMQGKRVLRVRGMQDGYEITRERESIHVDRAELETWLGNEGIVGSIRYLIQPYIRSETKDGNPFDIRAHLARSKDGNWQLIRLIPRVGASSSMTSNYSTGGYLADLDNFCKLDMEIENISAFKRKIRKLAMDFAPHMEKLLQYNLHQLAMDIGVDANGKLWLFEVNFNRIGVNYQEVEIARHAIAYAIHVGRSHVYKTYQSPNGSISNTSVI